MQSTKKFGSILGVWAHPDDETFLTGGLLYTAVKNGQRVCLVTATKGEAGECAITLPPNQTLADVRDAELVKALEHLGVSDHNWLGFKDGELPNINTNQAVAALEKIVKRFKPDTIVTFAGDGLTGHPDHKTVSAWVKAAAKKTEFTGQIIHAVHTVEDYEDHMKTVDKAINFYFMTEYPELVPKAKCDFVLELPKDALIAKLAALEAMPSQTLGLTSNEEIYKMMKRSLAFEHFVVPKLNGLIF